MGRTYSNVYGNDYIQLITECITDKALYIEIKGDTAYIIARSLLDNEPLAFAVDLEIISGEFVYDYEQLEYLNYYDNSKTFYNLVKELNDNNQARLNQYSEWLKKYDEFNGNKKLFKGIEIGDVVRIYHNKYNYQVWEVTKTGDKASEYKFRNWLGDDCELRGWSRNGYEVIAKSNPYYDNNEYLRYIKHKRNRK